MMRRDDCGDIRECAYESSSYRLARLAAHRRSFTQASRARTESASRNGSVSGARSRSSNACSNETSGDGGPWIRISSRMRRPAAWWPASHRRASEGSTLGEYRLRQSFPRILDEDSRLGNETASQPSEIVRCVEDRTVEVRGSIHPPGNVNGAAAMQAVFVSGVEHDCSRSEPRHRRRRTSEARHGRLDACECCCETRACLRIENPYAGIRLGAITQCSVETRANLDRPGLLRAFVDRNLRVSAAIGDLVAVSSWNVELIFVHQHDVRRHLGARFRCRSRSMRGH